MHPNLDTEKFFLLSTLVGKTILKVSTNSDGDLVLFLHTGEEAIIRWKSCVGPYLYKQNVYLTLGR